MADKDFLSTYHQIDNLTVGASGENFLNETWIDTKHFQFCQVHIEITANTTATGSFKWRDSNNADVLSPDPAIVAGVTPFNTSGLQTNPAFTDTPQNINMQAINSKPRYVVLVIQQTAAGVMTFSYRCHFKN